MNKLKTTLATAMQLVEDANFRQTQLSSSDVQRYLNKDELDKLQMHTQDIIRGLDSIFVLAVMLDKPAGSFGNADSMDIMKEADELKKKLIMELQDESNN